MGDKVLIAGNGGAGSVYFDANCTREKCGRPMTLVGGNRNRFTMRCPCRSRLSVFIATDPNRPFEVRHDDCPKGVNFNDYLKTLVPYQEWEQFYSRRVPLLAETKT